MVQLFFLQGDYYTTSFALFMDVINPDSDLELSEFIEFSLNKVTF